MRSARTRWLLCLGVLSVGIAYALFPPLEKLPAEAIADRVVLEKSARTLQLYRGDVLLKSYRISLGSSPRGAKEVEGDGRTPEGSYFIDKRNPQSSFHRALQISYPSASDMARARAIGKEPGGEIMIHGLRNGLGWLGRWHRLRDWTAGCVALTNAEMDEVWRAVPAGTPVQIAP